MSKQPRSIRATRIGGHAYRYLTTRPRTGRVVSTFSGGINILFDNGEAFVPVQTTSVPLHPWAIEMSGEPLRFAEGTPASVKSGVLSVEDTRIVLSNARTEDLRLPQSSATDVATARQNFPIIAKFVNEVRKTHPPDPFQEQIDAIVDRWHDTGDSRILLDLIGLGAGSTPSGDDVLVGIIAGMYLLDRVDARVEETLIQVCTSIEETARALTPLPSAQMLLAACDRSFPEPVFALLKGFASSSISEEAILEKAEGVAQVGHYSGLAMLTGLTKPIYSIKA